MPVSLFFFTLATPVFHYPTGLWIATGATGYVKASVSASWVVSLILGNKALVGALGLTGGGFLTKTAITSKLGAGLTAVGLGSLAPVAVPVAPTILGLTPVGWGAASAGSLTVAAALLMLRKSMKRINEERQKGGLSPISIRGLVREVRSAEKVAVIDILRHMSNRQTGVSISEEAGEAKVNGQLFSINRLKYVMNKDGSEEIVFVTGSGKQRRILLINPAGNDLKAT